MTNIRVLCDLRALVVKNPSAIHARTRNRHSAAAAMGRAVWSDDGARHRSIAGHRAVSQHRRERVPADAATAWHHARGTRGLGTTSRVTSWCAKAITAIARFLVLSGSVRVMLERTRSERCWAREHPPRRGWLHADRAALAELARARSTAAYECERCGGTGTSSREEDGTTRVFLQDFPRVVRAARARHKLEPGEFSASLPHFRVRRGRQPCWPTAATTLLEIRWQGLRDLMRRTPAIRDHIERAVP